MPVLSAPLLQVIGLGKSFGSMTVLHDVNLEVAKGEVVCIVGPSGCGKSTLLRCINYLTVPDSGLVKVSGAYLGREPLGDGRIRHQRAGDIDRLRPSIGFVFQQLNLWPHLTVLQNIAHGPINVRRISPTRAFAEAQKLLERFGLGAKADSYPAALSGGQRQRVAIARALAMDPALILFDEPTSALDPETVKEVLGFMKELAQSGMTMVVVTHEMGFARNVAHRVVFMDNGRVVAQGSPDDLLVRPSNPRLQVFLRQIHSDDGAASVDGSTH